MYFKYNALGPHKEQLVLTTFQSEGNSSSANGSLGTKFKSAKKQTGPTRVIG